MTTQEITEIICKKMLGRYIHRNTGHTNTAMGKLFKKIRELDPTFKVETSEDKNHLENFFDKAKELNLL